MHGNYAEQMIGPADETGDFPFLSFFFIMILLLCKDKKPNSGMEGGIRAAERARYSILIGKGDN